MVHTHQQQLLKDRTARNFTWLFSTPWSCIIQITYWKTDGDQYTSEGFVSTWTGHREISWFDLGRNIWKSLVTRHRFSTLAETISHTETINKFLLTHPQHGPWVLRRDQGNIQIKGEMDASKYENGKKFSKNTHLGNHHRLKMCFQTTSAEFTRDTTFRMVPWLLSTVTQERCLLMSGQCILLWIFSFHCVSRWC